MYLLFVLITLVISTKFLAITRDSNKQLFISHIHLEDNYTIHNIYNISKLGFGLSTVFDGKNIHLLTLSTDFRFYNIYNINTSGHINDFTTFTDKLFHIQYDGNNLLAIGINETTKNYILIRIEDNKIISKFNFKVGTIRASSFDNWRQIYYACISDDHQVIIYGISSKNFDPVSMYGPLSQHNHFIWYLLNDELRLYAIIFNIWIQRNQLVIINIDTTEIEDILTYENYVVVHAATLKNNMIYTIMSNWSGYYFVITDLYIKQYTYVKITAKLLPLNMWVV